MLEFVFLGGKCSDMHPTNLHIKLLKTILKQQAMLKGNISCWDQHIKEESLRFFLRYFRNSILSDTNLKLISNKDEKIFEVIYLTFITYSNVVHTSLLVRIMINGTYESTLVFMVHNAKSKIINQLSKYSKTIIFCMSTSFLT